MPEHAKSKIQARVRKIQARIATAGGASAAAGVSWAAPVIRLPVQRIRPGEPVVLQL